MFIEEMGGFEEWEKKCLADEKKWLLKLDLAIENLPHNSPATVDMDKVSKEELARLLADENFKYRDFFMIRSVQSSLELRQKLITFIQLHLLEDVESETEPTEDIIFRALKNYVELKKSLSSDESPKQK